MPRGSPSFEICQHDVLERLAVVQVDGMHSSLLANAIDTADPLLQPQGIPRQLQVDYEPALRLQVQALAGSVGCHQDAPLASGEGGDKIAADGRRDAAMDEHDGHEVRDASCDLAHDVSILAKNDQPLVGSCQQAPDDSNFDGPVRQPAPVPRGAATRPVLPLDPRGQAVPDIVHLFVVGILLPWEGAACATGSADPSSSANRRSNVRFAAAAEDAARRAITDATRVRPGDAVGERHNAWQYAAVASSSARSSRVGLTPSRCDRRDAAPRT